MNRLPIDVVSPTSPEDLQGLFSPACEHVEQSGQRWFGSCTEVDGHGVVVHRPLRVTIGRLLCDIAAQAACLAVAIHAIDRFATLPSGGPSDGLWLSLSLAGGYGAIAVLLDFPPLVVTDPVIGLRRQVFTTVVAHCVTFLATITEYDVRIGIVLFISLLLCLVGMPLAEATVEAACLRLPCRPLNGRDLGFTSGSSLPRRLSYDRTADAASLGIDRFQSTSLQRWVKRPSDVAIVFIVLPLAAVILSVCAVMVMIASPGPAFYRHERIGRGGRRFMLWKIRTMVRDADHVLDRCLQSNAARQEWKQLQKLRSDPRVIPWLGQALRRSGLDELPQLWNVLRGDMSIVGPRPIVQDEVSRYEADYLHYKAVQPGITGLWQVSGRNDTSYQERVAFDAYYVRHWSLWMDYYILLRTARAVLFLRGAY